MLQPPVSDLTPWLPGHWITQTGYALTIKDIFAGAKGQPERRALMIGTLAETNLIMEKVMRK